MGRDSARPRPGEKRMPDNSETVPEYIEYAREDTGADLPSGNGDYFTLRPGVAIPVVPDDDTSNPDAITQSFAKRLVLLGVCKPHTGAKASSAIDSTPIEIQPVVVDTPVQAPPAPEPALAPAEPSEETQPAENPDSHLAQMD